MTSLRDKDEGAHVYNTKQEVGESTKSSLAASSSSNSRQWSSGFKNPRIVRVSRTFGGKDRHSKVCTIKGLRDRRIRLSVPTAIQLYDLQDRLGLSQPSKVIDWLLDTTKHDIDKLPPLPVIPGTFAPSQGYGVPFSSTTPFFDANLLSSRKEVGININSATQDVDVDEEDESIVAKLKYWDSNAMMRSKQKGVDHHDHQGTSQVLAQNLFPIASANNNNNSTSILPPQQPSFLSNNPMLNYYHLEPSNLSLTQLGSLGLSSSHHNDHHNQGSSQTSSTPQQLPPSSLSLSSMSQLFLYPSMTTTSFFPQHHHSSFMNNSHQHQLENDMRQFSRFPFSNNPFSSSNFHNSSGLDMKPSFNPSMNHEPHHMEQGDDEDSQGKNSHNPWKQSSGN